VDRLLAAAAAVVVAAETADVFAHHAVEDRVVQEVIHITRRSMDAAMISKVLGITIIC
jgi:hypothetical protein